MAFSSAADEIRQWADQCRQWAKAARSREHRHTLQNLGKLLSQSAVKAERESEAEPCRRRPPRDA
jgi:hypothetical protein